jgi:hypothetical protein
MAITNEWLKQASSTQSYSKGKDYINDVDDLVKQGNTYTAVVFGSEEYEVMIDDTGITPHAECDCPYDHGGICKHIVAVGLNIIKGNFETEDIKEEDEDIIVNDVASTNDPSVKQPQILPTTTFYDDFFLQKEDALRTAFLRQLFANDDKLRRQFFEFSKPKEVTQMPKVEQQSIEKIAKKLNDKLFKISELDVDDFYSRGRGRYNDYYDDEGEGVIAWIDEKIEAAFAPLEIELKVKIQNGIVVTATEMLIGMYEGCLGLDFDGDLEDYMGDDFESIALTHLLSIMDGQKDALKTVIYHENDVKTSILLILNRWAKRKDSIGAISFFQNYFIALSTRVDIATWLIEEAKDRSLTLSMINLTLANAETVKNEALWLASAESVAKDNAAIMQLLLDKYLAFNNLEAFHKWAKTAFTKFEHPNFVPYLKTKVLSKYDEALYIDVHLKSATQTSTLDDFLTVRPLLSKQKEANFIEMCKKEKQNLYIDILNKDGNLAGILAFIEEQGKPSGNYFYFNFDLQKALSYIVEKFPDDVFDIVQFQTDKALKSMKMDRSGYASACANLKPLKKLPKSHQTDLKPYLESLRSRFHGKPAFMDELKKIGLG